MVYIYCNFQDRNLSTNKNLEKNWTHHDLVSKNIHIYWQLGISKTNSIKIIFIHMFLKLLLM